jgi:ParB/RepB/Spo0J family partition protein
LVKKKTGAIPVAKTLSKLEVEYAPIDWLVPNEYNPNRQSEYEFELLKKSITEDGMTQPVLCLADGRIVDGEHRWRACKALGHESIPVVKVDMSEEQRRVATLRHNLARGSHDIEREADVLKDLQKLGALEWAQEALQLSDVEVDRMLNDLTPLDEFGKGEGFSDSWSYDALGKGTELKTPTEAASMMREQQRALQQAGMRAGDMEMVNRGVTMTKDQSNTFAKAVGNRPADTIVAMAEAHVQAKDRAGKGEWTTLTFVVPTSALLGIEQELDRLAQVAPNRNPDLTPELRRGLALEYMAILSAQTPEESLQ